MAQKASYKQLTSSSSSSSSSTAKDDEMHRSITINARGTHIIISETHPIFTMSGILEAMCNFNEHAHILNAHILNVNVNPYSLQVLIDFAECRVAAQYDDQDAGEIIQEFAAKIFSDGALRWAVCALHMELGVEKPAEPAEMWTLNENLSIEVLHCNVDMQKSWTFIQAVAILALLLKEHLFENFTITVKQARSSANKLPEDNMIAPDNRRDVQYRFLPLSVTIIHPDDGEMCIVFGEQDVDDNWQSRTSYCSVRDRTRNAILKQLIPLNDSFAPFIEKLKQYLNIYQDTDSRHF